MFELEESWSEDSPGERELHDALFGQPAATPKAKSMKGSKRKRDHAAASDMQGLVHSNSSTAEISEGEHQPDELKLHKDGSAALGTRSDKAETSCAGRKRKRKSHKNDHETPASRSEERVKSPKRRKTGLESNSSSTPQESQPVDCRNEGAGDDVGGKKKKKKMRHKKKQDCHKLTIEDAPGSVTMTPSVPVDKSGDRVSTKMKPISLLHSKMASKMEGARFRWINEQLYTTTGDKAKELFENNAELFTVYHKGFQTQVSKWPINPLDRIITYVKSLPTTLTIADFGCGEALLAQSVPHTVHSFDLVACNSYVIACDMANVPLPNASVDVCVFCLSLMGTNVSEFVKEARRVLKKNGQLKICEIASRFTTIDEFVNGLEAFGFQLLRKETFSKMFVDLDFKLVSNVPYSDSVPNIHLKPCIYKKR